MLIDGPKFSEQLFDILQPDTLLRKGGRKVNPAHRF
jgi:hypothetical protein